MPSKRKKPAAPEAEKFPRKTIPCSYGPSDDENGRAFARVVTSPEVAAYRVIAMVQPQNVKDAIDTPTFLAALRDEAAAVREGNLSHAEAMLINQASALQALFVRLSERAMEQTHMPNLEGFMRMALRAQSQCRASLETLAAIKNPPIVYAKQANVTTGPQQVNNGIPSRAGENAIEQTQLSGGTHELQPHIRTPGLESRVNQEVEAVGEVHRAEVPRG